MAREISSISRFGRFEPFNLQVARGQISYHRAVTIFGYSPDVDQTRATVWPHPGVIPISETPIRYKVSSSNANDTAVGTGAKTVYLSGLDANHAEINEVVTLAGQTPVLTTHTYLHINEAYVLTAGTSNSALGNIFFGDGVVTAGVPATVYDLIAFDFNSRVTGSYTVPAGYTGYVVEGMFSAGQDSGTTGVTGRLLVVDEDSIRRTAAVVTVNNGTVPYLFSYPLVVPEKCTLEASAQGSANNNKASCMFAVLLVSNG